MRIYVILVVVLLVFSACSKEETQPVCNAPYILVGTGCCLDQNNNSICDPDEPPVYQQNVTCPANCDDGNECTRDVCTAGTNYSCVSTPIRDCCGNNICERNETLDNCRIDCPVQVNVYTLQDRIIQKINLKNLVFTKNETRDYSIYKNNVIWATILEAKTNDAKIRDFEDVRELAARRSGRVLLNFKDKANKLANAKSLEYTYEVKSTITQVLGENIVYDNYIFYYDIVSPEGGREFAFPEVYPIYTFRCTDDLAVEVNTDPTIFYQGLYGDGGKIDANVEKSILNYIKNQEDVSRSMIRHILSFCKG